MFLWLGVQRSGLKSNRVGNRFMWNTAHLSFAIIVSVKSHDGDENIFGSSTPGDICTGCEPIIPNLPRLKDAKSWTSRHAIISSKVREHLIILGSGSVGTGMATGSSVSLVCSSQELYQSVILKLENLFAKVAS